MHWANFVYPAGPMAVALLTYMSPLNRTRQRRKAVNERLYGSAVVFDRHGNPIDRGTETIFTQLEEFAVTLKTVTEKLNTAALLNGKGDQLIADVAETRLLLNSFRADSDRVHAALWAAIVETGRHP